MIELRLPLKDIYVTQPFGRNFVDFYQQFGLLGHNGIDFRAKNGCPVYASHDGVIYYCGTDNTGGIQVDIWNEQNLYKTIYYHLKSYIVKQGDMVKAGDLIGYADNTGKYTTGDHLHFGLKETTKTGSTKNWDNGYSGAIDPAPDFKWSFNGVEIGNKDWDKSRSYHRYYRGRPKGGYYNEVKVLPYLIRRLKRLPTYEEINAIVYGGWDIESVMNEAMYDLWSQLKKYDEFLKGEKPYQ